MSYKYKEKISDDLEDVENIIRTVAKMIKEQKIGKDAALDNLSHAYKKIKSAQYYLDRG